MFIHVRAMPRQVIPIFSRSPSYPPSQDKYSHDLSHPGSGLPLTIFPRRSISFLSKTRLSLALTSLPLGSDIEVSLPPTLNASPRGFQIAYTHDPTDTLHQQKPYISLKLTIHKVISLRMYLTVPGSDWGKYLWFPPWFMVSLRAPRESCFSDTFP